MAEELFSLLRFVHILSVVFMAAPLYNLIVVVERARMGKTHADVDRYMEKVLRGNSLRCYVFQITALVTGLLLIFVHFPPFSFFETWILAKFLLLLVLMGLLSVVHFRIQPRIDSLLSQVSGESIPQEISEKIMPLRLRRRRLASTCLFLVITTILVALLSREAPILLVPLVPLAALFSLAVYKRAVPFGWI